MLAILGIALFIPSSSYEPEPTGFDLSDLNPPQPVNSLFTDDPRQDVGVTPLTKPGPFTIEQLQAKLSSFEASASFVAIGDYPLGSHEIEVLQPVVGAILEEEYLLGFLILDINTGWGIAYNADELFYSASSIKGIYAASLASAEPNSIVTWSDSIFLAVHDSDNDEYFSLRSSFGHDPMTTWCNEAGVDPSIDEEWFPDYSPRTLAKLWLRNYQYFESGVENIDVVKSWYVGAYNSTIQENLGWYYDIFTKPGWIAEDGLFATIDAGIIYAGDKPYLMIVMTDAPKDFEALDALVLSLDKLHGYMYLRPNFTY